MISKYGKNYEVLAETLTNKTLQQIKNFFTNYKRKLDLPRRIAEYEISHVSEIMTFLYLYNFYCTLTVLLACTSVSVTVYVCLPCRVVKPLVTVVKLMSCWKMEE